MMSYPTPLAIRQIGPVAARTLLFSHLVRWAVHHQRRHHAALTRHTARHYECISTFVAGIMEVAKSPGAPPSASRALIGRSMTDWRSSLGPAARRRTGARSFRRP